LDRNSLTERSSAINHCEFIPTTIHLSMVCMSSSSSTYGVNLTEQIENVFDQLISKIEQADPDFDPRFFLKQLNVLGRYKPVKRKVCFTERYIEDYGISCHCKPSLGSSVVCGRDCCCSMLFSCCSSQCECDITSTNKSFQHRPLTKTKLVNPNRGGLSMVKEI
jgi:hypothetical protein